MSQLIVTGYSSLDYSIHLEGRVVGDQTTRITTRNVANWPRLGGCTSYVALAALSQGASVFPVTWTGSNIEGKLYLNELTKAGIESIGVSQIEAPRSPTAILAYQKDGSCACLFDSAFAGLEQLTASQKKLLATATHLCVSVGPPHLMMKILESRPPQARLYWILKNDKHCFTPAVCQILRKVANVIFCNQSERGLLGKVSPDSVLVETFGKDGVAVTHQGTTQKLENGTMAVRDTTGAGDTFAGGYIAAEMAGVTLPIEAAKQGQAAAKQLLTQRMEEESL